MLINIEKIGLKGLLLEDGIDLDEHLLIEEESLFREPVVYKVFFNREGEKIRCRGYVQTALSLRCVSCLESHQMKVDSKFDIILFHVDLMEEGQQALNSDEMEYIFFEGDEIDLEKILMEQINLYVPYNPVCSPDCRGICAQCGVNLNYDECQCEEQPTEMGLLFNNIKR